MKKTLFVILLIISSSCKSPSANKDTSDLNSTIYEILSFCKEKNISQLNKKYIHPQYGIYEVFRIGTQDKVKHWKEIEIKTTALGTIYQVMTNLNQENVSEKVIDYNVKFDCGTFEWDKEGMFITNKIIYPKISKIISNNQEIQNYSKSSLEKINNIEKNSFRIVITESDIIFYLTRISNKYYITLIDRVTTDCSA